MGLFKSERQRRLEREAEIRRGIRKIERAIRDTEINEAKFLEKAKRAKKLGDTYLLDTLFANFNRARAMRVTMERKLLTVETYRQIKDQADAVATFADVLGNIAKAISSAYKHTSLAKTAAELDKAKEKVQELGEQADIFMSESESAAAEPIGEAEAGVAVPRAEFDKLLEEEVASEEEAEFTDAIRTDLEEISRLKSEFGSDDDE